LRENKGRGRDGKREREKGKEGRTGGRNEERRVRDSGWGVGGERRNESKRGRAADSGSRGWCERERAVATEL
jgi:hypothetical protein